jgi:AraC-like DNA-binding protein
VSAAKKPPSYTYSRSLVRPFIKVLAKHPAIGADFLEQFEKGDPSERIPVAASLELLSAHVALTGDENLGLRAARTLNLGDFEVLEYAAASCRNGHEALGVIFRYIDLVNEAADFSLEINQGKAYVWLRSKVRLPRASNDYQVASFYLVVQRWVGSDRPTEIEVWFQHPAPADTALYREIFGNTPIRFNASDNAMVFDAGHLDRPLASAEPNLHEVLRRYADQLLHALPGAASVTNVVRKLALESLAGHRATIEEVANRMHVSRRTLHRQLAAEGTSFKALVDELRRHLALQHLERRQIGIDEVAFALGFADSPSFYRAFKRWTGQTPQEYRRDHVPARIML